MCALEIEGGGGGGVPCDAHRKHTHARAQEHTQLIQFSFLTNTWRGTERQGDGGSGRFENDFTERLPMTEI